VNEELQVTQEQLRDSNEELILSNEDNRQINTELENLLASIQMPIVMVDRNLLIRRFTPTAKLALNLIDADIGRPITELALTTDLAGLSESLREAMHAFRTTEREVQDRNGCWYSLRVQPYRTRQNTVEGAVVTMVNIDQVKRAEEELRAACERAEAATRAKDEFLSVVSHELRTPLVSILGYTQLLHVNVPDASLIRRVADVVQRNSKMQLQLIEDLLDTTRVMSGKLKLEMQPVDLAGVIRAALDVERPAADAKGLELRSKLDPRAAQITGDPERLQQIVWNLLSNAIKFTPKGGFVEVTIGRADPYVEIAVRDSGKGIEPDFLPHVFERFRQGDMSSSRRAGGLGLGLSLVKHLVELHGGKVEVGSAGVGQGATFTVRLPVRAVYAPPTADHELTRAVDEAELLAGVYALVVDDEQDVRALIAITLESYGAKVQTAASGQEELELLAGQTPNEQFDVLICDLALPDEDGYAVIQKVRALPLDKGGDIPAVALTAYGRAEYRMRALEAGFQTFAVKPVKPDELVGMIQAVIKQLVW
jgi:signal transduction histidine kinase/CheY-like chemotaxis protein